MVKENYAKENEKNNSVLSPPSLKKKSNLMSGVLVLSLSAVLVKIIGLIYKIPMLKLLGSEGMGYFNSAYEIFSLFCSIATTGLPIAMSVMISASEDKENGVKANSDAIFRSALKLFICVGVLCSAIMIAFAKPFAEYLGNENAKWCVVAIAPTVLWICLSSSFRGYFQGYGRMLPTAISQVIEALGKLILGLLFSWVALQSGANVAVTSSCAVLGLVLGTALSSLYLYFTKKFTERSVNFEKTETIDRGIMPRLIKMAVPITLSSAVVSLTKVIDMTMIIRRLQNVGVGSKEAFSMYGSYTTLALPLFGLAPALVGSIAMPLIPILSGSRAKGDKNGEAESVSDALRLTMAVSMPISVGLAFFSKPVLSLIFPKEKEAVEMVFPLLTVLAVSISLSCLISVGNAILQAYGSERIPIFSMATGSVIKIILAYFLIGNPKIGIMGAPISTFVCDMTINAINFYFIGKKIPKVPLFRKCFVFPFISAIAAVVSMRTVYNFLFTNAGESPYLTLICIALAALIYLALAAFLGVIDKKDILSSIGK